MLLQIHPKNPPPRLIKQIVESLQQGGVIIYPTDTVYGLGCDILQQKAVERICRIKKVEPVKHNCHLFAVIYHISVNMQSLYLTLYTGC